MGFTDRKPGTVTFLENHRKGLLHMRTTTLRAIETLQAEYDAASAAAAASAEDKELAARASAAKQQLRAKTIHYEHLLEKLRKLDDDGIMQLDAQPTTRQMSEHERIVNAKLAKAELAQSEAASATGGGGVAGGVAASGGGGGGTEWTAVQWSSDGRQSSNGAAASARAPPKFVAPNAEVQERSR